MSQTATGTTVPRSRVVASGSTDSAVSDNGSFDTSVKPGNPLSMNMNMNKGMSMNINSNNNSNMTPAIYLQRLVDFSQMDIQSALEQIKALLTPTQIQKVYK